jgi:hypothetical protein
MVHNVWEIHCSQSLIDSLFAVSSRLTVSKSVIDSFHKVFKMSLDDITIRMTSFNDSLELAKRWPFRSNAYMSIVQVCVRLSFILPTYGQFIELLLLLLHTCYESNSEIYMVIYIWDQCIRKNDSSGKVLFTWWVRRWYTLYVSANNTLAGGSI